MKKNNPNIPIMLREAAGTQPQIFARYGPSLYPLYGNPAFPVKYCVLIRVFRVRKREERIIVRVVGQGNRREGYRTGEGCGIRCGGVRAEAGLYISEVPKDKSALYELHWNRQVMIA